VTSSHHPPLRLTPVAPRPLRCLRHRVWMAACEDCRAAHLERLASDRKTAAAPR
jgi:hypothetical protein